MSKKFLDNDTRLIDKSKQYSYYLTFSGKVYRISNKRKHNDSAYFIYVKPRIVSERAEVTINKKTYDLMDLVVKTFSKRYKHIMTHSFPKDNDPLNCHGENISITYKNPIRMKYHINSKQYGLKV